jgi:outer membrane biogenesis lipoprotein LolB
MLATVAQVKGRRSKDIWLALVLLSAIACQRPPEKPREPVVAWHRLGTWSGTGNIQTESFESSGSLRVQWKAANETEPGTGTFRLAFHSSISGRELQVAVERKGVGADTAYVQQDPHVFFAKVESANLDWSFTVDEAVTTR